MVTTEDKGEWGYRSSVWVNQEIGILAYRKQFERVEIPIMVFKDKKGTFRRCNDFTYHESAEKDEILKQIELWLDSTEFPLSSANNKNRFFQNGKDFLQHHIK